MTQYSLVRGKQRAPSVQQMEEAELGDAWYWNLRLETLGRNLAVAGGLETQLREGMSRVEISKLQSRTKTAAGCSHPSTLRYSRVSVCTICLRAVDRWL